MKCTDFKTVKNENEIDIFMTLAQNIHQENMSETCIALNPTFIWQTWGMQGYIFFLLDLLQHVDCGYSLEPHRRGGSNVYTQSVLNKNKKSIIFYS